VILAVAIFGVIQSDRGRGFGAALAIYNAGKPDVLRANFSSFNNHSIMQVFVAPGVDDVEASRLGCGLVQSELDKAGLGNVPWEIYAVDGRLIGSVRNTCLQ
jgi:hypothetical protein